MLTQLPSNKYYINKNTRFTLYVTNDIRNGCAHKSDRYVIYAYLPKLNTYVMNTTNVFYAFLNIFVLEVIAEVRYTVYLFVNLKGCFLQYLLCLKLLIL